MYWAPPLLDDKRGRERVEQQIVRPGESYVARIEEPRLIYAPFWRLTVSFEATKLVVRLGDERRRDEHRRSHYDMRVETMVPALALLPYTRQSDLDTTRRRIGSHLVDRDALVPVQDMEDFTTKAEVYEGDSDAAFADRAAHTVVRRAVFGGPPEHDPDIVDHRCEVTVLEMLYCFCPLLFTRYAVEGEASRHPEERFFVLLDARTGDTLASRHPPRHLIPDVRELALKLRRFLSFDRR